MPYVVRSSFISKLSCGWVWWRGEWVWNLCGFLVFVCYYILYIYLLTPLHAHMHVCVIINEGVLMAATCLVGWGGVVVSVMSAWALLVV